MVNSVAHMNDEDQTACTMDADSSNAFEAVVEMYEAALLRYASRLVADPDAAQDVVQNTFIKLSINWKSKADGPERERSAWLYRVAHNLAVDYVRREARHHTFLARHAEEEGDHAGVHSEGSKISDSAERAATLLRTLNMREQQVITLKVYEEKSYREIADITGLSESNVGYILHYAMQKLALALEQSDTKRGPSDDTTIPKEA